MTDYLEMSETLQRVLCLEVILSKRDVKSREALFRQLLSELDYAVQLTHPNLI